MSLGIPAGSGTSIVLDFRGPGCVCVCGGGGGGLRVSWGLGFWVLGLGFRV